MLYRGIHALIDKLVTLERFLLGPDVSTPLHHPKTGSKTAEQIEQLPIIRRRLEWTPDGRLFVVQVRHCDLTNMTFRTVKEITE